jgi:predicted DNA-binding protein
LIVESETTSAFATRLPAAEAERLDAAIKATNQSTAELLRRAIRFYMAANPDCIAALYPEGSANRFIAELEE